MTFLQLEYFHAVAELGSISRVAEQYNISPAALSRSISQLERELGAELFDHEGRSIVLNDNGRIFMQCTAEILDAMIFARKRISSRSAQEVVRVRLDVMVDEPGELPIACKLARPELIVEIIAAHRSNKRFDIRFFTTPSTIDNPRYELVYTERFVAALPAGHPLAKKETIKLSDLSGDSFILYKYDQHDNTLFEMCSEAGFVPSIGMTFGMTAHRGIYRALAEGLGVSIVPERVSRAEWKDGDVALVPFSDVHRERHIYVEVNGDLPMNENCRFVVDLIKSRMS